MQRLLAELHRTTFLFIVALLVMLPLAPRVARAAPGFIGIHDAHRLGTDGGPWRAKAVQFWMTDYVAGPPSGWYNTWTAVQTSAYLAQAEWQIGSLARANLGANTLRIFFPFGNVTADDGAFLPVPGDPRRTTLDQLDRVLEIARGHGLRYTIVLFNPDMCGEVTGCWSPAQERFVTSMARHFQRDPYLAWWGTVNEINDRNWGMAHTGNPSSPSRRITWNWQIVSTLRTHDPNHLVSTSVQTDSGGESFTRGGSTSRWRDYLLPATRNPDSTLAHMVDFLTPHSFVGLREENLVMLRGLREAVPGKPIVLEETGWASGEATQDPRFSEEMQAAVIDAVLSAAAGDARTPSTAGAGIWMLVDFNGLPDTADHSQPHFGMFWSRYTASGDHGRATPPEPWSPKRAAAVVQHYFTKVWPD